MKNKSYWQNSYCRGGFLHRYEIVQEFPEGILEMCEICKDRKFFKLVNGQTDNLKYISYHIRQALPPTHKQFIKEYVEI